MKTRSRRSHPPASPDVARASARFDAERASAARADGVWHATFDGTAVGGFGRMAGGGVIYAPDGEVMELSWAWPGTGCNNEAEYRALQGVLEALVARRARRVHVWGDSDLVIRQLRGELGGRAARLSVWCAEVQGLAGTFEHLEASWVPRHRNGRADALAGAVISDAPQSKGRADLSKFFHFR